MVGKNKKYQKARKKENVSEIFLKTAKALLKLAEW